MIMQHLNQLKHNCRIIFLIPLLGLALLATLGSGCYLSQEKEQSLNNMPETGSNSSVQPSASDSGFGNKQKNSLHGQKTGTEDSENSRLLKFSCSQNSTGARLGFEFSRMREPRVSRSNANNTLLLRFPGAKLPDSISWEQKTAGLQMDLALKSAGKPLLFRLYHSGLRDYSWFVLPQSGTFGPRFVLDLRFKPLENKQNPKDNQTYSWVKKKRYAYKIKKGDYLYAIFKRHKVSPTQRQKVLQGIREINPDLDDLNHLQTGQVVYFPGFFKEVSSIRIPSVPDFDSFVPTAEYKVRSGEHLLQIMRDRIDLSYEQIYDEFMQLVRELNSEVENLDRLGKGQKIVLPLPPQRELNRSEPQADTSGGTKRTRQEFSANFFSNSREQYNTLQSAQNSFSQASRPGNPDNYKQDIQRLRRTLKRNPDNVQARLGLARIYHRKGASEEAGSILEQGIRRFPEQVAIRIQYARILIDKGRFRAALQVLEMQSPPKLKEQEGYYALIAYSRRQLAEYGKAAHLYRALTLNQPGKGKWWIGWGLCLEKQGRMDRAIEAYNRAVGCKEISGELKSFARERKNKLDR